MNNINQIVIWDWSERLFWAMAGVIVYSFLLGFIYDETQYEPRIEAATAPKIAPCLPVNKVQK